MGLKRKRVIISRRARRSIREIYDYIKEREQSSIKAHYVRQSLVDKCRSLKHFSGYSKERFLESYTEDYRSVRLWNYIIEFSLKTLKAPKGDFFKVLIFSNSPPEAD